MGTQQSEYTVIRGLLLGMDLQSIQLIHKSILYITVTFPPVNVAGIRATGSAEEQPKEAESTRRI